MNLSTFLVLLVVCACAGLACRSIYKDKKVENQVVVEVVHIVAVIRCVKIPKAFFDQIKKNNLVNKSIERCSFF